MILKKKLQNAEQVKKAVNTELNSRGAQAHQGDEKIIQAITEQIAEQFRDEISQTGFNDEVKDKIKSSISLETEKQGLDYENQKRIEYIVTTNGVGLGPLDIYMNDPEVTEIVVQRWNNICIEKRGIMQKVDASFVDETQLLNVINRIVQPVNRQINLSTPMVDARLSNGSRVNATIPPVTPDGATLCIRKFSDNVLTGADYIKIGSLNMNMLTFLAKCVEGRVSMIVSGGTSTGKTTLLNMLSQFVPENELIITIEDSCELKLKQPNVRRMEARNVVGEGMMKIDVQALVKNALRMRPDRIIVGEIRDGTIVDMMSAMSTGHEGSMSTVHANNPTNLMNSRMPILYSMHESAQFSEESQNIQISEALQLVVHISRLKTGERKITHITQVSGLMDDGRIKLDDIFVYNENSNDFEATGFVPKAIIKQAKTNGVIIDKNMFQKVMREGE